MLGMFKQRTLMLAAAALLVIILIILFAFSSCGDDESDQSPSPEIQSTEPSTEPTPQKVYETVYIGTVVGIDSSLNIRSEPSTSGTILGKAKNGDKFTVLEMEVDGTEWHKVSYEGVVAYVSGNYLVVDSVQREVLPTEPPTADPDDPEGPGLGTDEP